MIKHFANSGFPSFIHKLNFIGCVDITSPSDWCLSGTIHQPAVRGIHSKNVEHSGTHDTAMVLDCLFVFRHGTLRECPGFNAAGIDSSGDYFDIAVMVMFRMQKVLLLATMAHTAL
jgi:hypothetical protein